MLCTCNYQNGKYSNSNILMTLYFVLMANRKMLLITINWYYWQIKLQNSLSTYCYYLDSIDDTVVVASDDRYHWQRTHIFFIYIMVIQLLGKDNTIMANVALEDWWPSRNTKNNWWLFYKHQSSILDRQKSIKQMEVVANHTNHPFNSGILDCHSLLQFPASIDQFWWNIFPICG